MARGIRPYGKWHKAGKVMLRSWENGREYPGDTAFYPCILYGIIPDFGILKRGIIPDFDALKHGIIPDFGILKHGIIPAEICFLCYYLLSL